MTDQTRTLKDHWTLSSVPQRFEIAITVALYCVTALVALFALSRLVLALGTKVFQPWDITDLVGVQIIFGMVMTVLIALEFGNSLLRNLKSHVAIIHAKAVILIGLMAIVRKLIITDFGDVSLVMLLGIAAVILALGSTYWLIDQSRSNADADQK